MDKEHSLLHYELRMAAADKLVNFVASIVTRKITMEQLKEILACDESVKFISGDSDHIMLDVCSLSSMSYFVELSYVLDRVNSKFANSKHVEKLR